jgi:hypothetical protein
MRHWAEQYIGEMIGPLVVMRYCKVPGCKFNVRRQRYSGGGRGTGFREGNKQRGAIIQHIKECHPELKP